MVKTFGVSNFKRNAHANTLEIAFLMKKVNYFRFQARQHFFSFQR